MKTLVIGATGIIGNHIVRALLEAGHEVCAMSRGVTPTANLESLPVSIIKADINDLSSLTDVFEGIDWVFQAAPYYPDHMFQRDVHVKRALFGLRNVVQALKQSQVKRLIYTSSLSTIGFAAKGQLADETYPYTLFGKDPHPYFLVKYLCEEELTKVVHEEGLPVVFLNPAGCFGPYEHKPRSLCFIPQLVSGEIPAFVKGDINVVNVADVARGHVLAAQKGRDGQRYILGGHNISTLDLLQEICDAAKIKPPKFIVPISMALLPCYLSEVWARLFKRKPSMPILGIRFIQYAQHVSSQKAIDELGYEISPMMPCFEKAIAWYKKIGYC